MSLRTPAALKLEPITSADFPRLEPLFARQRNRYSAYTLPSILCWSNDLYHPVAALDGDTLVVGYEFSHDGETRHLILPISPTKDPSPEYVLALAKDLGFASCGLVPEDWILRHGREKVESLFRVEELEGYADYVYLAESLAKLEGRDYAKKRNLVRQFNRDYVDKGRFEAREMRASDAPEVEAFLEEWCRQIGCDEERNLELRCEKRAAIHAIRNVSAFKTPSLLARVDGDVSAFGIAARATDDLGVLLFEKAFAGHKGLYQFFDQLCAQRLFPGLKYIDKECDMGDEGLAKAKRSYYPVEMIRAFRLSVR